MTNKKCTTAWCPLCGDAMEISESELKPHQQWTYYCFGCDKYFNFKMVEHPNIE